MSIEKPPKPPRQFPPIRWTEWLGYIVALMRVSEITCAVIEKREVRDAFKEIIEAAKEIIELIRSLF
jgi:hypothetical protein